MSKPVEVKDCQWPWNRLYVNLNGDAKPCCYATFSVVNLNDPGVTLDDAWSGTIMEEVREAVRANKIHRVCAGAGCAYIRSRFPEDMSEWTVYDVPEGIVSEHTRKLAMMGQRNACYAVGYALLGAGRADEAFVWMERSAEQGLEFALYWLATRYLDSTDERYDAARGIAYLQSAADQEYTPAITYLARCCQYGVSLAKDEGRAVELYRRAADRGDASAWLALAHCYRDGVGVTPDSAEARRHLQIAVRRGSDAAQAELNALEAAA